MSIPHVVVDLEINQTEIIMPVIDKLETDVAAGKRGMVLAQVSSHEMRVFHLPAEIAEPVHKLITDYFKNLDTPNMGDK